MGHKYNELAASVHQDMIDAGWWQKNERGETIPKNVGELLCLVHSEIDEGFEGHCRHQMDDHLPDFLMARVEAADTAIRIFDLLGYYNPIEVFQEFEGFEDIPLPSNISEFYMAQHIMVSAAMEAFRKGNILKGKMKLWAVLDCLYQAAETAEFDLNEIIEAKRAYNRNRADHKLEARAAEGGKKF